RQKDTKGQHQRQGNSARHGNERVDHAHRVPVDPHATDMDRKENADEDPAPAGIAGAAAVVLGIHSGLESTEGRMRRQLQLHVGGLIGPLTTAPCRSGRPSRMAQPAVSMCIPTTTPTMGQSAIGQRSTSITARATFPTPMMSSPIQPDPVCLARQPAIPWPMPSTTKMMARNSATARSINSGLF